MFYFDSINVDGPKKKLLEFNHEHQILDEKEVQLLDSLMELIKKKEMYHSSKLSKPGFELVRKLLKFPADKAFPSLDIYRMLLMHPHLSEHYKVYELGLEYIFILVDYIKDPKANQNTILMALRCLVNLFQNTASMYTALERRAIIVETASPFATSDNKHIRYAVYTLFWKYSIYF